MRFHDLFKALAPANPTAPDVIRAAKRRGYSIRAYTGAQPGIKIFKIPLDRYKVGMFSSSNAKTAESFARWKGGVVLGVALRIENPFVVDAKGESYDYIRVPTRMKRDIVGKYVDTDNIAEWAYKHGHDGAVIKNVFEGTLNTAMGHDYVVFHPSQVKLLDAVTYDDEGRPIPLDRRFDRSTDDVRY